MSIACRPCRFLALFVLCPPLVANAQGESSSQAEADPVAEPPVRHAPPPVVDRVIARFTAPEMGGAASPRFILERELAFEARLEALADPGFRSGSSPYRRLHVRAALERHVAETILEALEVVPQPTTQEVNQRVNAARVALAQRVGGVGALSAAAQAEGLAEADVFRLLERQAKASLYLDRMVAPMLNPSEAELLALHHSGRTPFNDQPYREVQKQLRRWLVSKRLREAALSFFESARARVRLQVFQ